MSEGYVYFVACKDPNYRIANPHMKIGHTTNLWNRLGEIQVGSPVALCFMGYIESDNSHKLEHYFHTIFKKDRKHGEWFDVTNAMITRICSYKVLDNHFDEFFLKPEEIASREICFLKAEIEDLKETIARKDKFISEMGNTVQVPPVINRNRMKGMRSFTYKALQDNK
jgi:hypothetical protein